MAISFVAEAHGTANYTTSISISKPPGTINGDVMIAVVGGSPSTPSGWTLVGSADSGTNSLRIVRVFRKVAASEGSSYSFTISTSLACGSIVTYRGVDTTTPIDASTSITADSGTDYTTGSLTASGSQWAVAFAMAYEFGSSSTRSWTETPGTERSDYSVANAGSPDNTNATISDSGAVVTAGSYSVTQTRSASSSGGVRGMLLLNQLGGGVTSAPAGAASVTLAAGAPTTARGIAALPGRATVNFNAGSPKALAGHLAFAGVAHVTFSAKDLPRKIPAGVATVTLDANRPMTFLGTPPSRVAIVPPDLPTNAIWKPPGG